MSIQSLFAKLFSVVNTRYVNRFVTFPQEIPQGDSTLTTKEQHDVFEVLKRGVKNVEAMGNKYPVIKEICETIVINMKDLENTTFTVDINHGKSTVSVGSSQTKSPTIVLPLYKQNVINLEEITKDGELDPKDLYRFIRVLFIPFLRGLYQRDYSHLPKDKSYLQLDNFLHVEVLPFEDSSVPGFPGPARATVVNVDGQWLVFEGFQGDPDVTYSMTLHQALEFAYLIQIKLMQTESNTQWSKIVPIVKRYNALKKEVTVYERGWHTLGELD